MQRVIVFGAGHSGENYIKNQSEYRVIASTDNDERKHNTLFVEDIPIIAPSKLKEYDYDLIIIASIYTNAIKKQLIDELGIHPNQVIVSPKALLKSSQYPFEDEQTINFARESLITLTSLFEDNEISYFIDFGTLLGIVRDGDLITWDDDIDLSILKSNFQSTLSFLKENIKKLNILKSVRWRVHVTYNGSKDNPVNIGLSFEHDASRKFKRFQINIGVVTIKDELAVQSMNKSSKHHFEEHEFLNFNGVKIRIPADYERYLEHTYGNWKIPKKDISFEDYPFAHESLFKPYREYF